ncbi:MAG: carboxylating nicotinate-nucleotide diphosphorylase [Desulfurococcales archaeon]|nr:carboxylating nicotinate-nucleotide diphosphorylase [Desulfurococcales archaeon]
MSKVSFWLTQEFTRWVREDSPFGDLTTELLGISNVAVNAVIIAKSEGVTACMEELVQLLESLEVHVIKHLPSGVEVEPGEVVVEVSGRAGKLLLIERTLLNLMSYLFGVATSTRKLVESVRAVNPKVRVAATRKVPPGLRYLAKKAVRDGGGDTHRYSLSDAVMIKDNHIKVVGGVREAVRKVRGEVSFIHKVEVEVESVREAVEAALEGADVIMLDNMTPEEVGEVIDELKRLGLRSKVIIEVSGGITPENISDYAALDVDVISSSYMTMNPERVDLSLEITKVLEE